MRKKRNVVLVCGSHRDCNPSLIYQVLDVLHKHEPFSLLVQGYARNTDRVAHQWARERGVPSTGKVYQITSGQWAKLGRAAGPLRNQKMRDTERPDMVVAFPGGPGTRNMCELADEAGIKVLKVSADGEIR